MGYKSRTTINKIELGVNDIPQSKITKFADVLGVSISYLMGLEKESEDLPALNARILKDKKTVEMIDNFYKLDTAEQMAIRTTIEALANKK